MFIVFESSTLGCRWYWLHVATLPKPTGNRTFGDFWHTVFNMQCFGEYFLEGMYVLLLSFPEDGTPLVVLRDFIIHLEKLQAVYFHALLSSLRCLLWQLTNKETIWALFTHATDLLLTSAWLLTQHALLHRSAFGITYAQSRSILYIYIFHPHFLALIRSHH